MKNLLFISIMLVCLIVPILSKSKVASYEELLATTGDAYNSSFETEYLEYVNDETGPDNAIVVNSVLNSKLRMMHITISVARECSEIGGCADSEVIGTIENDISSIEDLFDRREQRIALRDTKGQSKINLTY